jgi:hypothetical protein
MMAGMGAEPEVHLWLDQLGKDDKNRTTSVQGGEASESPSVDRP